MNELVRIFITWKVVIVLLAFFAVGSLQLASLWKPCRVMLWRWQQYESIVTDTVFLERVVSRNKLFKYSSSCNLASALGTQWKNGLSVRLINFRLLWNIIIALRSRFPIYASRIYSHWSTFGKPEGLAEYLSIVLFITYLSNIEYLMWFRRCVCMDLNVDTFKKIHGCQLSNISECWIDRYIETQKYLPKYRNTNTNCLYRIPSAQII